MSILGRKVSGKFVWAASAFLVAVVGLLPVMTRGNAREITVVVRNMAFYVEGNKAANPVIEVNAGETVRIVLRNLDRGMTHDFVVPAFDVSTDLIDWNEQDSVTFDVPDRPGTYEYVCKPHLLMMKGTLKVI
jgi:plastocyanin